MIEVLGVKYITDKEASQKYGLSRSWFQKIRQTKMSPPYVRFNQNGRVYYEINQMDDWFKSRLEAAM